jgi:hypothetical protein
MKKQQETMKLYNKAGVNPGLYLRDSNAFWWLRFSFSIRIWVET